MTDDFYLRPPALKPDVPAYYSGLDLGQSADYSALVILERTRKPHPTQPDKREYHFDARHIHRWPLKTSYVEIAADLKQMFAAAPLSGSVLVVDKTGVGAPVCDMLTVSGITAELQPMNITCGHNDSGVSVAKVNLVSAVQSALQGARLRFAAELELTPVLRRELETFRVTVNERTRNESFAAYRESDHDDLVLALALALHAGSRGETVWAFA